MSSFTPEELPPDTPSFFEDEDDGSTWIPIVRHECSFSAEIFLRVMMNLIKNPNINSKWLFRADILSDEDGETKMDDGQAEDNLDLQSLKEKDGKNEDTRPISKVFKNYTCQRTLLRRLIPRNEKRDAPLVQTCTIHSDGVNTLVIYLPHLANPSETPFYHPVVAGIAHLYTPTSLSVHYLPYPSLPPIHSNEKLLRTAHQLLQVVHKHGKGQAEGYTKRVLHDQVIPQERFQDTYAGLKGKYAKTLVEGWMESTDSGKHVFEDLGIAAFLIELWRDMYSSTTNGISEEQDGRGKFPGFVDIGCGNGLLVYILNKEGYAGWGFDARTRKSWAQYTLPCQDSPSGKNLEQRLLVPSLITVPDDDSATTLREDQIHNGEFPDGVFLISNHADELTPWTPILSILSSSISYSASPSRDQPLSLDETPPATKVEILKPRANPFIIIPCCSHSLTGAKYRPPPPRPLPRNHGKGRSSYASLVDWTEQIGEECGWVVEREMLRIPSTRNTCLVGRRRVIGTDGQALDVDGLRRVVDKFGGVDGFYQNVAGLVKTAPRGH